MGPLWLTFVCDMLIFVSSWWDPRVDFFLWCYSVICSFLYLPDGTFVFDFFCDMLIFVSSWWDPRVDFFLWCYSVICSILYLPDGTFVFDFFCDMLICFVLFCIVLVHTARKSGHYLILCALRNRTRFLNTIKNQRGILKHNPKIQVIIQISSINWNKQLCFDKLGCILSPVNHKGLYQG